MKSTWWFLSALLAVVWLPGQARATSVLRAPLEDLAADSAVIFHGWVRAVDDDLSVDRNGPFRTAIAFEVVEPIKGLAKDQRTFELVLPGGRARDRRMVVPGMPRFAEGDEVVLLLEKTGKGYALTGLAQGVFFVSRDVKGVATVRRAEHGIYYVNGEPGLVAPPRELGRLLTLLRASAGVRP